MPLTSSAKKALRVDRAKKEINDLTRNKIKSALKAARLAIVSGDTDATKKIDLAYRELDLAAKKNVIHKNKASRLKSRLTKKLAKVAEMPAVKVAKSSTKKSPAKKTSRKM
ncbi:MAG: 30S ribosomal protein S20 [Candidatus Berkelbacteria bacterium]|nr:30S ribosomal protein S20 [Candidatus Berkelbacteria bacterium]